MFQAPTAALMRDVSPSFAKCVTTVIGPPIDMQKAIKQHEQYSAAVKSCIQETVEVNIYINHLPIYYSNLIHKIASDENHADCCFIEDTVVVVGQTAVINCLGHESRRGEVGPVQTQLELAFQLGKKIHVMSNSPGAHIDGGDVLTMPTHQFVGLSKRSNLAGVEFLRQAFGGAVQIHAIDMLKVAGSTLHLKCLVSGLDAKRIVVVDSARGRAVFDEMQRVSGNAFTPIYVPDEISANVLSFPWAKPQPTVLVQAGFPASELILRNLLEPEGWKLIMVEMSEFIKADGALTCCSVLV
ncbi:N(G),N(G)-dimethylarginine dimethylaminohydrolase 1 [Podochytrium sp. JEL0797]|nr:N(G),N(G)-dimethylarginine dimethylaminohydrolase 1 [Podochytrium sp. JEL0797]